ncbi:MAG: hypothetical protein O7E52_21745 [Candidatus Poribacteria bacterium]|nr:hypothetical protein [Candidatus Poribacteria bacterium]
MKASIIPHVNSRKLVREGQEIYDTKLKTMLEPGHTGEVVAIDVISGDYFIGNTLPEAAEKAKAQYPERLFYFAKIGYPVMHRRR